MKTSSGFQILLLTLALMVLGLVLDLQTRRRASPPATTQAAPDDGSFMLLNQSVTQVQPTQ